MRRRGVRVFIIIAVIVALAIATLSFKELHIPIFDIDRENKGPLGLKLGLDLQGGIDLVYRANIPVEVIFKKPVEKAQLDKLLNDLGHLDATVVRPGQKEFTIPELSLDQEAEDELRTALEKIAPVETFRNDDAGLEVTFRDNVDETELRDLLEELGHTGAIVTQKFTIRGLALDVLEQQELRIALAVLADIEDFDQGEALTPDMMEGVVDKIERRVNALGTAEPIIQILGKDRVWIQLPGVGGTSIDVAFQSTQAIGGEIASALRGLGRAGTGDTLELASLNSFVIRTEEALTPEDMDELQEVLAERLGPVPSFEGSGDKQITVSFPSPPDEQSLRSVLAAQGLTDYTIQESPFADGFVIRTKVALTTKQRDTLREALEAKTAGGVDIQVTGGVEEAKQLIGATAQLVFRERECLVSLDQLDAARGVLLGDPCEPVELGGGGNFVDKDIDLTGTDLARAFPGRNPTTNAPEIHLEFNSRGRGIFSDLTERLQGDRLRRMAIYLDEVQLMAPVVIAHITDGRTRITGQFTREEVRDIVIILESGRLDVPLVPIREGTVDALLGADSLRKSLIAGLVGLGLVFLFMVVYYRMAGVVAGTALLVYAVVVLALFKLIPVTLTLAGLAGLVLSIGIAVDANILIFERMKEEMRTGRTLTSAMEVGFRRAWPAIRDSNVSTMITCLILWWFGSRTGTPLVTNLGLTLLIGVSVSMFTALMVSRNMLQILALTPLGKKAYLFTPEPRRQPVVVAGASPEPRQRGGG